MLNPYLKIFECFFPNWKDGLNKEAKSIKRQLDPKLVKKAEPRAINKTAQIKIQFSFS